jgi:hypothetical protein
MMAKVDPKFLTSLELKLGRSFALLMRVMGIEYFDFLRRAEFSMLLV